MKHVQFCNHLELFHDKKIFSFVQNHIILNWRAVLRKRTEDKFADFIFARSRVLVGLQVQHFKLRPHVFSVFVRPLVHHAFC